MVPIREISPIVSRRQVPYREITSMEVQEAKKETINILGGGHSQDLTFYRIPQSVFLLFMFWTGLGRTRTSVFIAVFGENLFLFHIFSREES